MKIALAILLIVAGVVTCVHLNEFNYPVIPCTLAVIAIAYGLISLLSIIVNRSK